jgi:pimeloyl-ACP methyl ester carboxylesterase
MAEIIIGQHGRHRIAVHWEYKGPKLNPGTASGIKNYKFKSSGGNMMKNLMSRRSTLKAGLAAAVVAAGEVGLQSGPAQAVDDGSGSKVIAKVNGASFSGRVRMPAKKAADTPLIIAVHGGTYTSAYFDIPGYSLLDQASALGIPIIAIDRPGYAKSTPLPDADATIKKNAEALDGAIAELWKEHGAGTAGVVIIAHSIGAACTIALAARHPKWPLLGIALSGVGVQVPSSTQWDGLPPIPFVMLPSQVKDGVMFGPDWTFTKGAVTASHGADAAAPKQELLDIVKVFPGDLHGYAAAINVPVHYRQAEFDHLWIVGEDQIKGFNEAFTSSPNVDGKTYKAAGHCIDFHKLSAAFHAEQLAFALRQAVKPA